MFDKDVMKMQVDTIHWTHVSHILDSLIAYGNGKMPRDLLGHFVGALVDGNLFEACGRADTVNQKYIYEYVYFMYNELPSSKINLKHRLK